MVFFLLSVYHLFHIIIIAKSNFSYNIKPSSFFFKFGISLILTVCWTYGSNDEMGLTWLLKASCYFPVIILWFPLFLSGRTCSAGNDHENRSSLEFYTGIYGLEKSRIKEIFNQAKERQIEYFQTMGGSGKGFMLWRWTLRNRIFMISASSVRSRKYCNSLFWHSTTPSMCFWEISEKEPPTLICCYGH